MELNFNSVEMSREPRAEASSLDYAEAKLTFNSVETVPNLNASAAFFPPSLKRLKGQVDSGKVFKEDVDMVPTIIDKSLSYMPWDGDNMMPYNILKLIEDDEPSARQSLQHESLRQQWRANGEPLTNAFLLPAVQCRSVLRQRLEVRHRGVHRYGQAAGRGLPARQRAALIFPRSVPGLQAVG